LKYHSSLLWVILENVHEKCGFEEGSGDKKSSMSLSVKLDEASGSIRAPTPHSKIGEEAQVLLTETGCSEEEVKCLFED
jgi:hypothetical protein